MISLPFAWRMRLSSRALRPRITINTYGKVELVWPKRMSQRSVKSMLVEHQAWVLRQLEKLPVLDKVPLVLPHQIHFAAIEKVWDVKYEHQTGKKITILEGQHQLTIRADGTQPELIRQTLLTWLKKKGKVYLQIWLDEEATAMGLSYQRMTIRLQKRRWGSCSAKKHINLNAALLFLPKDLVKHVLIHELAHLKHLNHSSAFWEEVSRYDADYAVKRKKLRTHSNYVPAWVAEKFGEL